MLREMDSNDIPWDILGVNYVVETLEVGTNIQILLIHLEYYQLVLS